MTAGIAAVAVCGCDNIGNAPQGASPEQVKAELNSQSPLQQIRAVMFSPTSDANKEKQIKALEDKYHVKREDAMKDLPPVKFNTSTPPPEKPTGK